MHLHGGTSNISAKRCVHRVTSMSCTFSILVLYVSDIRLRLQACVALFVVSCYHVFIKLWLPALVSLSTGASNVFTLLVMVMSSCLKKMLAASFWAMRWFVCT